MCIKLLKKTYIDKTFLNTNKINITNPRNYVDNNKNLHYGGNVDAFLKNPEEIKNVEDCDAHNF